MTGQPQGLFQLQGLKADEALSCSWRSVLTVVNCISQRDYMVTTIDVSEEFSPAGSVNKD
jgi:hypothetical protein